MVNLCDLMFSLSQWDWMVREWKWHNMTELTMSAITMPLLFRRLMILIPSPLLGFLTSSTVKTSCRSCSTHDVSSRNTSKFSESVRAWQRTCRAWLCVAFRRSSPFTYPSYTNLLRDFHPQQFEQWKRNITASSLQLVKCITYWEKNEHMPKFGFKKSVRILHLRKFRVTYTLTLYKLLTYNQKSWWLLETRLHFILLCLH